MAGDASCRPRPAVPSFTNLLRRTIRPVPEPDRTRIAVVAYDIRDRGGEERVLVETVRRTHDRIS